MNFLYRALAVICGVLSSSVLIYGQPSLCTDDAQCTTGYYCEASVCHKCVRCEDLKRESPVPQNDCVKSVLGCGGCLKGFVEDLRLDRACILLSERSNGGSVLPPYAWAFIVLLLLVFAAIVIYIVWKKDTLFSYIFKIRASTHASVHSRCTNNGNVSAPSTLDPPPPYNPYYEPIRPVSPSGTNEPIVLEDSSVPFIKRTPAAPSQRGRDSAGSQAAQPFNNPAYVRGPAAGFGQVEDSDPGSPFPPHDEDTIESHWTPNETINNNISENATDGAVTPAPGGDVAGAIVTRPPSAALRRTGVDSGPPSKVARLREDTNNNRGHESSGGSGAGSPRASPPSPSPSPAPPHSLVINVVTNINNLEQRNSVNLPKH